ncbi:hypothetical protein BMT54_10140 [Pasteurellaceae bacterium 15-036681]|nr:hypothetical protein BMT54_10140 [Pasteurellaceae bacterium 15-036681]
MSKKMKASKIAQLVIGATTGVISLSSFSNPISIEGIATSKDAISVGTNSFATAVDGIANGQGSIATGQGFSREEFNVKINEQKALLDEKTHKEKELDNAKLKLDVNDKAQENLAKDINDLTKLIDSGTQKLDRLNGLNDQLAKNNSELPNLQQDLDATKKLLPIEYITGENKNIAIDFTPILNNLDYNKLKHTDGRNELAQDLKIKLETDFPAIQGMFTEKQYLDVLNEFVSKRSSYDAFRSIYDSEMKSTKYKNISVDNVENTGAALENVYLRHGESIESFSREDIYTRLENDKNNHAYSTFQDNYLLSNKDISKKQIQLTGRYEDVINALYDQLIISSVIADTKTNTSLTSNQYSSMSCSPTIGNYCFNSDLTYVFKLAPLNEKYNSQNKFEFNIGEAETENLPVMRDGKIISFSQNNHIHAIVHRIITDKALSTNDLEYIKNYYEQFNLYANSINYDSDRWIVDKDKYRANLQKVLDFNSKLEEYRQLSETIRQDASNDSVKDALLARQIELKKEIESLNIDSSYFQTMSVSFNDVGKNEINKGIDYVIKQEDFIDKNLRYYDGKNVIITSVQDKIKEVQQLITKAQNAVDNKQSEIDQINQQIKDLALTPNEQGAVNLKAEKERELADKQAEKEKLEADKAKQEDELNKINEQLANSGLKDLGLRSQAHGSNAFASGNDSIAIGTGTTVTSTDGISIGRNSNVTGSQSIAIGADNTVSGDKSIAIGVGHTVKGNHSTTIGDPNVVNGDDNFVAGNNNTVSSNNVMVMGNNVTVAASFDGAVVLGDNSTVAKANPTSSIDIQGKTHNFTGTTPSSTVSVGAKDKERQITNVAAGRISDTSTDAINGSQLYAIIDTVNNLSVLNLDDISDDLMTTVIKAGNNISIDSIINDSGEKSYTINANVDIPKVDMTAGKNTIIDKVVADNGDITYTVSAKGTKVVGGSDNVKINTNIDIATGETTYAVHVDKVAGSKPLAGYGIIVTPQINDKGEVEHVINANGTTVSSGAGIAVKSTTSTTTNGATITNYEVSLTDVLAAQIAKEESVSAGSSNVVVKQDGTSDTGGKNFVVDLAKNINLSKDGSLMIGGINIANNDFNVGGNIISNVAEGVKGTDAVNVNQLNAAKSHVKAGDKVTVTETKNADGSTNFAVNALTSEIINGVNAVVTETLGDKGQSVYKVDVKGDLTNITSITNGDTKVTLGDGIVNVGGAKIANIGKPTEANDATNKQYVDDGRTRVTSNDNSVKVVATKVGDATNYDLSIDGSLNTETDDGVKTIYKLGDTIAITGDARNISTSTVNGKTQVKLADDVKVNSVTTGPVSISTQGINAGHQTVTNVAKGEVSSTSTDAVNGSQLHATNVQVNQNTQDIAKLGDKITHLDTKIDKVNKEARAGVAGAVATASLPQVYMHGKSMVSASAGHYKNENAVAVGYSRASDNGKLVFKLNSSANTRGDFTVGTGIGYQW